MNSPRAPEYRLMAKDRNSNNFGEVGCAWAVEEEGKIKHISLRLNPGVTLRWNDELIITLFPNDAREHKKQKRLAARIKEIEECQDPPMSFTEADINAGVEASSSFKY